MRIARIALILSAILVGTPVLQAQTAHTDAYDTCGCASCQQPCQAGYQCENSCSSCGILPGLTSKLGHSLGSLLRVHIGCDGRHSVYKAALCRNSFDKKFRLPIAYYGHILPFYRHNRCCCGSVIPAAPCPTCGPQSVVGEEVIEMDEVPPAQPMQPTPAARIGRPIVPGAVVPPKSNYERYPTDRSVAQPLHTPDRVVQQDRSAPSTTLRNFTPMVLRPEPAPVVIRQVSAVEEHSEPTPGNPLR